MLKLLYIAVLLSFAVSCGSYSTYDPMRTSGYIIISGKLTPDMYFLDPNWGYYFEIHDDRIQGEDSIELYVSTDQSNWLKIDTVAVVRSGTVINKGTCIVSDGRATFLDDSHSLLGRYYNLWVYDYNARNK